MVFYSCQTEYRLGPRFGRINRTYTGLHAFLAIAIELFLASVFGVVSLVVGLALRAVVIALHLGLMVLTANWHLLVAVMSMLVYCLTLPFALLHHAVNCRGSAFSTVDGGKPDWAAFREL